MLFACALGIHPDKMCTDGKGWLYGLLSLSGVTNLPQDALKELTSAYVRADKSRRCHRQQMTGRRLAQLSGWPPGRSRHRCPIQ